MEAGLQHFNNQEVLYNTQFSRGGASALLYGTAVLATIFLMQGCCVATYYSSQCYSMVQNLVIDRDLLG